MLGLGRGSQALGCILSPNCHTPSCELSGTPDDKRRQSQLRGRGRWGVGWGAAVPHTVLPGWAASLGGTSSPEPAWSPVHRKLKSVFCLVHPRRRSGTSPPGPDTQASMHQHGTGPDSRTLQGRSLELGSQAGRYPQHSDPSSGLGWFHLPMQLKGPSFQQPQLWHRESSCVCGTSHLCDINGLTSSATACLALREATGGSF